MISHSFETNILGYVRNNQYGFHDLISVSFNDRA